MAKKITRRPDLKIANHGSIFLLQSNTPAGQDWIRENIQGDAQTWCGAIVVEHRYILPIVEGAVNDGLLVADEHGRLAVA